MTDDRKERGKGVRDFLLHITFRPESETGEESTVGLVKARVESEKLS